MSRNQDHAKFGGKDLSDVLNPLKGYLRANLGRPWDKIYSELCQNLDRRSVSGNHVFQHIWDFVAKNCWIGQETRKVYELHNRGWSSLVNGFYVHPFTGLLKEQKLPSKKSERAVKKAKEPVTLIKLSPTSWYEKLEGIWYYLENYEIIHEHKSAKKPHFIWGVKEIQEEGVTYVWKDRESVYHKYQLNGKELKKLGLENERKLPAPFSRRESKRLSKIN